MILEAIQASIVVVVVVVCSQLHVDLGLVNSLRQRMEIGTRTSKSRPVVNTWCLHVAVSVAKRHIYIVRTVLLNKPSFILLEICDFFSHLQGLRMHPLKRRIYQHRS